MTDSTVGGRPPVLVTGATGSSGQALWQALLRRVPARAMVRKPSDADRFVGAATDAAVADLDDATAVAAALEGVERAYLVTPSSERAEAQQVGFVEAAARVGVRHLVVLSQLGAREDSPVRFLRYHAAVERRVRELGLGHTLADIGEVAATVLTDDDPRDATLTLTGPQALTHAEMAESLSAAVGRKIVFTDVSPEAFAAALEGVLPPWQVAGLTEDYAHYRRGEAAEVSSAVRDVTERPPRPFDAFALDNAAAFSS